MRKISVSQIKSCASGVELANYCNGLDVDEIALVKALGNFGVSLSNLVKVQYDNVAQFDTKYSVSNTKDGKQYSFKFKFSISGTDYSTDFVLSQDGYDKMLKDISNLVSIIIEGSKAVDELNKLIQDIQFNNGSAVQIIYRFGLDKFCMISSWDFDKINVRLGETAIMQLIELRDNDELEETVRQSDWQYTIVRFILNFNSIPFHKRINAINEITSFEGMLLENMLETDKIPFMVRCSRGNTGTQVIRTVSIIKELGKFLVLIDWYIDYSRKSISMSIVNDKVLDLEDDRFISDREIVNRIEKKIDIPENIQTKLFDGVNIQ